MSQAPPATFQPALASPNASRPIGGSPTGPAWDIATLFPDQGFISEGEYLWLSERSRRLVEFSDGRIEVLAMPKMSHQLILMFLLNAFSAFCKPTNRAIVLPAALRVRLRDRRYREPDIVLMLTEHLARAGEEFWEGADLVVEIVSESDPDRDLIQKRLEYADAGIPEYWVVDPRSDRIQVLTLSGNAYQMFGEHVRGSSAKSSLLQGFEVSVDAVFDAGRVQP